MTPLTKWHFSDIVRFRFGETGTHRNTRNFQKTQTLTSHADPKNPRLGRRNLRRRAIAFKKAELQKSGICPDARATAKRIVDTRFDRAIAAAQAQAKREVAPTLRPTPVEPRPAIAPPPPSVPGAPASKLAPLPAESAPLPPADAPKRRNVRRKPTEAEAAANAALPAVLKTPRKPRTPKAAPSDSDAPASKPKRVAKPKPADGGAAPKSRAPRATKTDGEPARRVVRHVPGSTITNASTSAS